jgi:arginase
MRYIDEMGVRKAMQIALEDLGPDTHLHVSFDVDFLDPQIAPGVGTTVAGGMSYREAQLCMEMIADSGLLGSLDIMELNPALDVRNKTAVLAVDLVESLFGKSTLMRAPAPASGRSRPGSAPGAKRTRAEIA